MKSLMSKKTIAGSESLRVRQPRRTRVILFGIVRRSFHSIGGSARSGSTSGRSLRGRCCGVRNGTHGSCGHSRRLRNRGTENEETIQRRLKRAETEIANSVNYDEHVVNVEVDSCAESIYSIIQFKLKHGAAE